MQRFKSILCVASAENDSSFAIDQALLIAKSHQASLKIVEVVQPISSDWMRFANAEEIELVSQIVGWRESDLRSQINNRGENLNIEVEVLIGTPFLEVIREVVTNQHDLLLKEAEDPKWLDHLFGSDDMHLLRKCPCPVWLVNPEPSKKISTVVATVDVADLYPAEISTQQDLNEKVLDMASSIAISELAELHIVCVWNAPGESMMRGPFFSKSDAELDVYLKQTESTRRNALLEVTEKVFSRYNSGVTEFIKPELHLIKGFPQQVVPDLADKIAADLVVMGTVGRVGVPGLLMGNTAEGILNRLDCSVLAVKPEGFITPVH